MKLYKTIVSLSIVGFLFVPTVFAATPSTTPVSMAAAENKAEYSLPYPGILPDHPLFFLKKFRDAVMEMLIADPMHKIEFYILQADKNINMGVFLTAKQKNTLATEILTRGENRMAMAVATAATLKKDGKEVPAYLIEKMTNALVKHEEVVMEIEGNATIIESINKLQDDVGKLNE